MDKDTLVLYKRCIQNPNACSKLQRMTLCTDQKKYIEDNYVSLFHDTILTAARPFAYRVGQWYHKHLIVSVYVDTTQLQADFQIISKLDDGRYVNRQMTLVHEHTVALHRLLERVCYSVRASLEAFDDNVIMYGIQGISQQTRDSICHRTHQSLQQALTRTVKRVKERNHAYIRRASNDSLPCHILNLIDTYVFGRIDTDT